MRIFGLNNYQPISSFRINALQGGIFFLIILIVGQLFYIQIIQHNYYLQKGLEQRAVSQEVEPERGRIFALASENGQELYPLAINKVYYEVSVNPSKITRPQNVTDILVEILELDEAEVLSKIKKENRYYELIAKDVSREKVEELKSAFELLKLDINKDTSDDEQLKTTEEVGVNFIKNVLRFYPDKEIGAHILGFLGYGEDGYSRVGKYGLEGYFEKELAGFSGQIIGETDVQGGLLADNAGQPVEDGADLILTIDRTVQYTACKALEKAVVRYDAQSGSVIIMESKTGAIRAMCNYQSFDTNEYSQVESPDIYNNNAVYYSYEPGSVMKAVAMAIAIDDGKVTPDTTYNDEGEIKFANSKSIKNAGNQVYGLVDMKDVLALSINTGIVEATSQVNNKIFEDYMKKFGFGRSIDISISQESNGDIISLSHDKADIYKATASYGQGITVTPLQMLNAVNVIANRGNLVQPYIVQEVDYPNGEVEKFEPITLRQVISKSTAAQLSAMMVNVLDSDESHVDKARVDGYYVAGKTGTAQVYNPQTSRYYSDKFIHNFVGFAPNDNPKFTMIVKLDYPTAALYSADTAAPVFGEIAQFLLEYYQVPPNR